MKSAVTILKAWKSHSAADFHALDNGGVDEVVARLIKHRIPRFDEEPYVDFEVGFYGSAYEVEETTIGDNHYRVAFNRDLGEISVERIRYRKRPDPEG